MLSSPRSDLHPPCISRTFALTSGGPIFTLADSNPSDLAVPNGAPFNGVTPPGNIPSFINHLASTLFLVAATGTFIWTDVYGNVNTFSVPAGGYIGPLPFTIRTIGDPAATQGTVVGTLTASWEPGA